MGTILVCGTVSQWIKAVQLQKKFRKEYHHLQRLGYFDNHLQLQYAQWVIEQTIRFLPEFARFIIACDDTPIKRYGNKIQGCSWHYHQTNGNRNSDLFYGYPLVVLSLIIEHPIYGTISAPLANRLYVSQKALDKIPENIRPEFKTKIELLIEMVEGIAETLKLYNKPIILLFDRGYVSQSVFEKMNHLGVKIITRFKSNVNLYSLPENSTEVRRGRPRKYGEAARRRSQPAIPRACRNPLPLVACVPCNITVQPDLRSLLQLRKKSRSYCGMENLYCRQPPDRPFSHTNSCQSNY